MTGRRQSPHLQTQSRSLSSDTYAAYRKQAFDEIAQRVRFLSCLTDGRNVEGFSAMRAVGTYVIHNIMTSQEFADHFEQAYRENNLLSKIGPKGFEQTVQRALEGCLNDRLPRLRTPLKTKAPNTKKFHDTYLISQGFAQVATYQFFDRDGGLRFEKRKYCKVSQKKGECSNKKFLIRHLGIDGQWYCGRGPHPDVPYNLKDMLENTTGRVFLCEGEKDVETAKKLGLLAVCVSNWRDCKSYFKHRKVVILPDNDDAGAKAAERAYQVLFPMTQHVLILQLPDLPPGGDFTDWIMAGGTLDALDALVKAGGQEPPQDVTSLSKSDGSAQSCAQLKTHNGVPLNTRANLLKALKQRKIALAYNQLKDAIELTIEDQTHCLNDRLANRLRFTCCEEDGFRVSKEHFNDLLTDLAYDRSYHPVQSYLSNLTWDQTPRVARFFIDLAGAEDTPFHRRITQIWFTAAVRRIFEPGTDFQELLILEGAQGGGKSTAIQNLVPHADWFCDDLPLNAPTKLVVEQTLGKWIIEASELTGRTQDIRALKRFLSSRCDSTRLAYDRFPRDFPRQWTPIGTTNETEYLIDSTGNRRFWPITIKSFDLARLTPQYRDQIWAEATHLHTTGLDLKLEPELWSCAAHQQDKRFHTDPWEDILISLLPEGACHIVANSVLETLHIPIDKQNRKVYLRIAYIMRKLGFEKSTQRHPKTKKTVKVWLRGEKMPLKRLTFSGLSDL